MSNKQKTKKQSNKPEPIIKNYKNPMESLWGKIIVWVLLFAMVGVIILGLVLALTNL